MGKTRFFLLLFLLCPFESEAQTPCASPPSSTTMDQQFHDSLKAMVNQQKIRIAIFPFQDGSLREKDPTLEKGFPIYFYDLLKEASKIGIYHPLLTFQTATSLGLTSADFFEESKMIQAAASLGATHLVYGMFQRQQGGVIRYFVKIADVSSKQNLAPVMEFQTLQSDRFFSVAADAVKAILKTIGGTKYPSDSIKNLLKMSPQFEAFRYYIKGMEKSASYKEIDLNIAKVWFEKATTTSYSFAPAFDGMARSLFMTALIYKQMGKDASLLWGEGRRALNRSFALRKSKKSKKQAPTLSATRWLNGSKAFIEGMSLFQSKNPQGALAALAKATALVPEDGIAHYYLYKAYSHLGNAKASQELSLANQLNSCIR